jgi:predicted NBD/HSP70 family sugar kinase
MQGGTNLPRVRDYNQGLILEAIRIGENVSRNEIAARTGLTKQTVSLIVKNLLDQNLVQEVGTLISTGGKRAIKLQINAQAHYAIGVQIDIDQLNFVVMALDGSIIAQLCQSTDQKPGSTGIIRQVSTAIKELIAKTALPLQKILGIGVGCPGPLDYQEGIVHEPPLLTGWHEVPLKQLLEEQTDYRVIVDNDATAAAIGERWVGGARDVANFGFIYVGVGVGSGLFIDNQIYRGSHTFAGEIGHMSLNPQGPACFCGNYGCLELYCAPAVLLKSVQKRLAENEPSSLQTIYSNNPAALDFQAISEAALSGDKLALEEVKQQACWLGYGIVNLVNLLDLELVILGGRGLPKIGETYRQLVQQVLNERLIARNRRQIKVELTVAGELAGAVGAASLILHDLYAPKLLGLKPEWYKKENNSARLSFAESEPN